MSWLDPDARPSTIELILMLLLIVTLAYILGEKIDDTVSHRMEEVQSGPKR